MDRIVKLETVGDEWHLGKEAYPRDITKPLYKITQISCVVPGHQYECRWEEVDGEDTLREEVYVTYASVFFGSV